MLTREVTQVTIFIFPFAGGHSDEPRHDGREDRNTTAEYAAVTRLCVAAPRTCGRLVYRLPYKPTLARKPRKPNIRQLMFFRLYISV